MLCSYCCDGERHLRIYGACIVHSRAHTTMLKYPIPTDHRPNRWIPNKTLCVFYKMLYCLMFRLNYQFLLLLAVLLFSILVPMSSQACNCAFDLFDVGWDMWREWRPDRQTIFTQTTEKRFLVSHIEGNRIKSIWLIACQLWVPAVSLPQLSIANALRIRYIHIIFVYALADRQERPRPY